MDGHQFQLNKLRLNRRQLLELMGASASLLYLSACGADGASVNLISKEEAVVDYSANQAAYGGYDEWRPDHEVEILAWAPPGDETDPFIRAVKAAVDRFQQHYPTIKVNWEPVPGQIWIPRSTRRLPPNRGQM